MAKYMSSYWKYVKFKVVKGASRHRYTRFAVTVPRLSLGDTPSHGCSKGVKGGCLISCSKLSKGAPSSMYVSFPFFSLFFLSFFFFLLFFLPFFFFFIFSYFSPASGMQEQGFLFSTTHFQNDVVWFVLFFFLIQLKTTSFKAAIVQNDVVLDKLSLTQTTLFWISDNLSKTTPF